MGRAQGCAAALNARELRLVGDPVDVVTGALRDVSKEFTLPGRLPLYWQRHYDSSRLEELGAFGWGHKHEYELRLTATVDGFLLVRPDGQEVLFPYALDGKPQRVASHSLVWQDPLVAITEPKGESWVYTMDGPERPGQLREIRKGEVAWLVQADRSGPPQRLEEADRGRTVDIEYDTSGRVCSLWLRRTGAPRLSLMRYRYDARGDLVEAIDRYGNSMGFGYDHAHRMLWRTDRNGYRFIYEWDAQGRCIRSGGHDGIAEIRLEYQPEARLTWVTRADGGRWLYAYDEQGSLTRIVDPYGGERAFSYDNDGRVATETDPSGNTLRAIYDGAGSLIGWSTPAGGVRSPDSPSGSLPHRLPAHPCAWELGDLADRVLAEAPPASEGLRSLFSNGGSSASKLFTERDARVEPRCRRDELGLLVEEEPQQDWRPRRWSYTGNGWVRSYQDHNGNRYQFDYTSWNHRIAATDPLGRTIRYSYTSTEQIASVTDPAGNHHRYVYDLKDNLTEVHHYDQLVETYVHDKAGNLIEKRDARGRVLLRYEYGAGNLKTKRRLSDGEEHLYSYDADGRFLELRWGEHRQTFAYAWHGRRCRDQRDRLGVEHRFSGDVLKETEVLGRFTTRYVWEEEGALRIEDPTGRTHRFFFYRDGRIRKALANGLIEEQRYNSAGRCLEKTLYRPHPIHPPWRREFEYNAEGHLLGVSDSERGSTSWRYDAAHQLQAELPPDGRELHYRYDAAGNLLEAPHLRDVHIGPKNQLVRANGEHFTYDYRNNVETWTRDGRVLRLRHDSLDRLRAVEGLDQRWTADYDPLGRRFRKTWGETWTEYYWDTDRLGAEIRHDGTVRVYVYADDFSFMPWMVVDYDKLEASPADGRVMYLFTDQRAAPLMALDQERRVVWEALMSPFGVAQVSGCAQMDLRFPGHFWDEEMGWSYNRFRYYHPQAARYVEEDLLGVGGGIHLYGYTNNPLVLVDLRGLMCDTDSRKGAEDAPLKKMNFHHIFHGEINRRGNPVGFHHEGSIGHEGKARVISRDSADSNGCYNATVEIFDPATNTWKQKDSSFFPADWSRQRVITETRAAHANSVPIGPNKWRGTSPSGVVIEGYTTGDGNDINTAFPKVQP